MKRSWPAEVFCKALVRIDIQDFRPNPEGEEDWPDDPWERSFSIMIPARRGQERWS